MQKEQNNKTNAIDDVEIDNLQNSTAIEQNSPNKQVQCDTCDIEPIRLINTNKSKKKKYYSLQQKYDQLYNKYIKRSFRNQKLQSKQSVFKPKKEFIKCNIITMSPSIQDSYFYKQSNRDTINIFNRNKKQISKQQALYESSYKKIINNHKLYTIQNHRQLNNSLKYQTINSSIKKRQSQNKINKTKKRVFKLNFIVQNPQSNIQSNLDNLLLRVKQKKLVNRKVCSARQVKKNLKVHNPRISTPNLKKQESDNFSLAPW